MQKLSKIYYLMGIVSLFLGFYFSLHSQMRPELKDFLWKKDFDELMTNYAEETVLLHDTGNLQKRLEVRSFYEAPGYRIQTFAGSDMENAGRMAENLVKLEIDSVYVIEDAGLFKVQIGNFLERLDSEKMLDQLRFKGITNAWIVETTIHVSKQPVISPTPSSPPREIPNLYFAIQIFVTKDLEKAKTFLADFHQKMGSPAAIVQSGEYYKVLAGKFTEEMRARKQLEEIRRAGYPDAWLTQMYH